MMTSSLKCSVVINTVDTSHTIGNSRTTENNNTCFDNGTLDGKKAFDDKSTVANCVIAKNNDVAGDKSAANITCERVNAKCTTELHKFAFYFHRCCSTRPGSHGRLHSGNPAQLSKYIANHRWYAAVKGTSLDVADQKLEVRDSLRDSI